MTILTLETTGPIAEIAVVSSEAAPAVETFAHRMDLAQSLMPRLDALLAHAGVPLSSLDGIAVSLGPGSYTGIRIGVVTAKALAYAANIPLAGVPTLAALAEEADTAASNATRERLICALLPARADEYFVALYQRADGELRTRAAVTVMGREALAERLVRYPGSVLLAASSPDAAAPLAAALGPRAIVHVREEATLALAVAALGRRRLAEGGDDPATLAPLYVRAPTVTLPDGRVVEA